MTTKIAGIQEQQPSRSVLKNLLWVTPLAMFAGAAANLGLYAAAGRLYPEVQRQVKTSGGLARAGDTDQDHVGLAEFVQTRTVVVDHGEIDDTHTVFVSFAVGHAVAQPLLTRWLDTEFIAQGLDESCK